MAAHLSSVRRLRGAFLLLRDAVTHGSAAVEKVHLATSSRPFHLLKLVPEWERPVGTIHQMHDLTVEHSYAMVRLATDAVTEAALVVLRIAERRAYDSDPK